jgi:glycosidase
MGFAEDVLASPRPESLRAFDLPRRQGYFPSPVDWRNEVLYFLLVDRFSDGNEAARPLLDRADLAVARPDAADGSPWRWDRWVTSGKERWQGGTLRGVRSKLGYLRDLGISAIWLSPVFRQRGHLDTFHGYGVQDFLDVDPRFGDRADLRDLIEEAHRRGMRVLLDVIFNHTGTNWLYEDGRLRLPYTSGRHHFGSWRGAAGEPVAGIVGGEDGVWPRELQDPDAYTRAGAGSLAGNDVENPLAEHKRTDFETLRDIDLDYRVGTDSVLGLLARVFKHWIALSDCDGFRIDTLKHVTLEQARNFCGTITEFAANLGKENFLLIGEIAGGDRNARRYLDVAERNLDAALDIGEMRPTLTAVAKGLQAAGDYFGNFRPGPFSFDDDGLGSHRTLGNRHVSILDDHDQVFGRKLRFSVGAVPPDTQVVAGVAIQLLALGIPCIYYGTEQAFRGPEPAAWPFLDGLGSHDVYLREAMFGPEHPRRAGRDGRAAGAVDGGLPGFGPFGTAGRHAFDPNHPAYRRIAMLAEVRRRLPVLRHGRQYLRQLARSADQGFAFRPAGDLVAWSRILDDEEALIVVNANGGTSLGGAVVVDAMLNAAQGAEFEVVASTAEIDRDAAEMAVGDRLPVQRASDGTAYLSVPDLPPGEVVVLVNRS